MNNLTYGIVQDEWKKARGKEHRQLSFTEEIREMAGDTSGMDRHLLTLAINEAITAADDVDEQSARIMISIANGYSEKEVMMLYSISQATCYRNRTRLRNIVTPILGAKPKGAASRKAGLDQPK